MSNTLRLADYSDRELLLLLKDLCNASGNGYVSSEEVAQAVGLEGVEGKRSAGTRLGYLKRIGAVVRSHRKSGPAQWALSDVGEVIATGTLSAAQEAALRKLRPSQVVLFTRHLAMRTVDREDPVLGAISWREYRRSTGRR